MRPICKEVEGHLLILVLWYIVFKVFYGIQDTELLKSSGMGFLQIPIDAWILASEIVHCILEIVPSFFLSDKALCSLHFYIPRAVPSILDLFILTATLLGKVYFHSPGKETETQRV